MAVGAMCGCRIAAGWWRAALLLWAWAAASPAAAELLLNEVLYDPAGSDAGGEWVELLNTGPWPAPTAGLALEFANGAGPGDWDVVWIGSPDGWIEAGARFLVGAREDGAVDSEARLGLQNGPDALRLVRDGFVLDLVGWGEPLVSTLAEGAPALPTREGDSLSRVDGVDTNDNRVDFTARKPTPGRLNVPRVDLAISLVPADGRVLPVDLAVPRLRGRLVLENQGLSTAELANADVTLGGNRVAVGVGSIDPGEQVRLDFDAWASVGETEVFLAAHVRLPGDEDATSDRDTLAAAIWPGPVRLSEIHPRPVPPQGEWIELQVEMPTALENWRIEDAAGGAVRIISTDPAILGRPVLAAPGGVGTLASEGWPTLNDRAAAGGIADTLFLIDPGGRIRDWVPYGEAEPGFSWVRSDGPPGAEFRDLWRPDRQHPGGTPGESSSAESDDALWPLQDGVSLAEFAGGAWIDLPPGTRSYIFEVYDLGGRRVWSGGGRADGARVRWDARGPTGEPLRGGLYVLDLRAETAEGIQRERRTVVVDR